MGRRLCDCDGGVVGQHLSPGRADRTVVAAVGCRLELDGYGVVRVGLYGDLPPAAWSAALRVDASYLRYVSVREGEDVVPHVHEAQFWFDAEVELECDGGGAGELPAGSVTGRNSASIQAFPVVSVLGAKVFGREPLPWSVASPVVLAGVTKERVAPERPAVMASVPLPCGHGIGRRV